jgi:PilZ domain
VTEEPSGASPDQPKDPAGADGGSAADRIADRVAVQLPVKLEFDTAPSGEPAVTGNVSNTGMYVAFKSPPPVGTLARFEIQRSDGSVVRGIGEVAWIRVRWTGKGRPPGMGIHFRFLDREGRKSLEALIADGLARGLKIEGDSDTDRHAARPPDEPDFVVQHRPYGKPLTMDQPLRPISRPTSTPSAPDGEDEASQGWGALRKWANSPAPVRAGSGADPLGQSATPLLGGMSDKVKLILFGVLILILLIVLL